SCGLAAAGFNLLFIALTFSSSFSIGLISFSTLWIPCSVWGHRSGSLSFLGRTRAAHVRLAHQTCQDVAVLPSVQRGRNYDSAVRLKVIHLVSCSGRSSLLTSLVARGLRILQGFARICRGKLLKVFTISCP